MKKIRFFVIAALMAVGTLAPQTVSAYKYYIHTGNGNVIPVKADNSNTAIDLFNLLIEKGVLDAETAYLTKRPNGGCIAGCENRE